MFDVFTKKPRLIKCGVCLSLLLFFLPLDVRAMEGEKTTICFFSPESNINNYTFLKESFNQYLSDHGGFLFQPFNNQGILESYAKQCKNCVFLLSSWYYERLKEALSIESALTGTLQGDVSQKRILSINGGIQGVESLRGLTLATASSKEFTRNTLLLMLGEDKKELIDSVNLLTVPKDIDALMTVAFGIASASLTTERSLEHLREISKIQAEMLKPFPVTGTTPLPIIAVWKDEKDNPAQELLRVLTGMGQTEEGRLILNLIGLDGFELLREVQ